MNLKDMQIDLLTPYYCDHMHYKSVIGNLGGKIYEFNLPFEPGKSRFNVNKKIDDFLKNNYYDVVHVHSGSISILCIMAYFAKKNGVPKVITHSHCAVEHINLKNKILRTFAGIFMKSYVDVYCACSKIAGECKYTKQVVENKMIVLNNGVDLPKFKYNQEIRKEIRDKYHLNKEAFVIGHVGRFSYQKNHEYLIRLFKGILERQSDSVLMLVGGGELESDVKKQVKDLGIESSVIYCGNVNNVHDYMQAMDIFVLPSRYEGLPIVGVEAQAAGLPIVVSEHVSRELDLGKDVVFLPLDNDITIWVDKIMNLKHKRYLENTELLRQKGYDICKTAEIIRDIYIK